MVKKRTSASVVKHHLISHSNLSSHILAEKSDMTMEQLKMHVHSTMQAMVGL